MLPESPLPMAAKVSKALAVPRTYAELLRAVQAVVVAGRQSIEDAWVRSFHDIGELIAEHLLLKQPRADYGAKIFAQLAAATKISNRTLHECVQFYRCYPIVRPGAQLAWSQYRLLCQVIDPERRAALWAEIQRDGGTKAALETRVRALNAALELSSGDPDGPAVKRAVKILKSRRGTPGLHRVVARDGDLAIDAGFKFYVPFDRLPVRPPRGLNAGDIVSLADGAFALAKGATAADLFTYRAKVRRAIDGDTLAVTIFLPHGQMDEKLRLRGLDCPEMDTPEGKAAKRFTEALLVDAVEVIIATSKVDKYDRYLANVYLRRADGEMVFLNNALLENGHAVPMGNEEMTDWRP